MNALRYRAHLVTIRAVGDHPRTNAGEFQAYLREGVDFDLRIYYDSIFRDVLKWRDALGKAAATIDEIIRRVPGGGELDKYFSAKVFGPGVAWTRKFGGVPEHLEFSLPCRLWVESSVDDITARLEVLYDLVVPELGAMMSVYSPYTVMVSVGNWFVVDEGYVTRVSHRWADTYVQGVPAWCDVDIEVTTVYAVDRNQLRAMKGKIQVTRITKATVPTAEIR